MGKRKREPATPLASHGAVKYDNIKEEETFSEQEPVEHYRTPKRPPYNETTATVSAAGADLVTDEERSYFRAIKEDLESAVQRLPPHPFKVTVPGKKYNQSAQGDEDSAESFEMVWERIEGREIAIFADKELSFIIEHLLQLTGVAGAVRFMTVVIEFSKKQPESLVSLLSHSCASHIFESIHDSIAMFTVEDAFQNRWTLQSFYRLLMMTPDVYFRNSYAAHVAEKMLLRLCHIVGYKAENGCITFRIYDCVSGSASDLVFSKDEIVLRKFVSAAQQIIPNFNLDIIRTVIESLENHIAPNQDVETVAETLRGICNSVSGSVVIQALLMASIILCVPASVAGSLKTYQTLLSWIPGSTSLLLRKLAKIFLDLSLDKYGSRVAELLIAVADQKVYKKLTDKMFGKNYLLENIIQDQNAHHSIIKLVVYCSEMSQLVLLTEMICAKMEVILVAERGLILVKLAKKLGDLELKQSICGRHGSAAEWNQCQAIFVESLKNFYGSHVPKEWTETQKRDYFVISLGVLYPRNFKREPEAMVKGMGMPGSQVLQGICSFKDGSVVSNSFLKLSPELLTEYCCNVYGSYTVETILRTQRNNKNFYLAFLKKIGEIVGVIAMTKFGSRTFDNLWKIIDLKHREALLDQLIPLEKKLKTNDFGRFLLPKLNIRLYSYDLESWRNQQKQFEKQKDELKAILQLAL